MEILLNFQDCIILFFRNIGPLKTRLIFNQMILRTCKDLDSAWNLMKMKSEPP